MLYSSRSTLCKKAVGYAVCRASILAQLTSVWLWSWIHVDCTWFMLIVYMTSIMNSCRLGSCYLWLIMFLSMKHGKSENLKELNEIERRENCKLLVKMDICHALSCSKLQPFYIKELKQVILLQSMVGVECGTYFATILLCIVGWRKSVLKLSVFTTWQRKKD